MNLFVKILKIKDSFKMMRVAGHIFGVVNGEFLVLAKSGRDKSIDDDE